MSCNLPCVAACAVDSQGRDACRDESRNKRNDVQRSSLVPPAISPSPPVTPGDMKPIMLMGSGSIHLNSGLHMMTMMTPRATCHQPESHEKNLVFKEVLGSSLNLL